MNHQETLRHALNIAQPMRGSCAPNPAVGACVVKDDNILAQGVHNGPSTPHAEIKALQECKGAIAGASLYVTLEPCCHHGLTPPCTEAIISAGISEVFYGAIDSNPKVAGQGIAHLQAAGIKCQQIELPEITDFYRSYNHWRETGLPWVTAKIALSLDGKIAGINGSRIALTGDAANDFTQRMRYQSDAILTTVRTVIADNPQLNARVNGTHYPKDVYIVDRGLKFNPSCQLMDTAKRITLLHNGTNPEKVKELQTLNIHCQSVKENNEGLVWHDILSYIGSAGVHDLWVEAGGRCFSSLLGAKRLNRAYFYVSPKFIGSEGYPSFTQAQDLVGHFNWQQLDRDGVLKIDF